MGLKDWIAGKVENKVAQSLDTREEVQAMLDNAPPLPKPPLGWDDWFWHTVIMGGGGTAALAAAGHQLADGFQWPSDAWAVFAAFLAGASASVLPGEWAKSNRLLTITLTVVAGFIAALANGASLGHLTQHDLQTAGVTAVAAWFAAFRNRPDEKAA